MTYGPRVSRDQAVELLDFGGRVDAKGVSPQLIEDQLDGAVAAHNLLQSTGVAYVADEVGTGKTLVAAGALALLRHREPGMKAMIVAPRSNLQQKWRRELETFARSNVRYADLRVRGLAGEPARRPLTAPRLSAAVSMWQEAPDADLITRLSSFQLGHSSDRAEDRRRYADSWHHVLGAAGSRSVRELLDDAARRSGDHVKLAIAACVNRLLPDIGVLVVDEAHNLKGGVTRGAARNRVLWTMLGHNDDFAGRLPGYGPRVERVLMLSATPMEDDTDQLLNQLVVLGVADRVPGLQAADEGERLAALHTFLFRRLTKMRVGGQVLTRNRYRQEWRQGGTVDVEQPLPLEDLRDRLTFAVVQKKVAEALNNGGGGAQFQIGMLTSFESLAESTSHLVARNAEASASAVFDGEEQLRQADDTERQGVDANGIRQLVQSHVQEFGRPPDHPKMDAVVDRLVAGARRGRKALVFTRRVASVDELVQRVNDRLDADMLEYVRQQLPGLEADVDRLAGLYESYRSGSARSASRDDAVTITEQDLDVADDESPEGADEAEQDVAEVTEEVRGGKSLFEWLFRQPSKDGVLTGWALRQRFETGGGAYVNLLRDNYVAATLGCDPEQVQERLTAAIGGALDVRDRVDALAQRYLGAAAEPSTQVRFQAAQLAALHLLEEHARGPVQTRAAIALGVLTPPGSTPARDRGRTVSVVDRLGETTLATELRKDRDLCAELWHAHLPWSWVDEGEFRRREWGWRLLGAAVRLDFPALDLWLCEVRRSGGLERGGSPDSTALARDFLDLLRAQRGGASVWTSYDALRALSEDGDLVLEVNGVRQDVDERPSWLGNRVPAVGMSGQVNASAIRQFRTPTYPLVLISTDLLQEGEDLHTFCDEVHHYGIAWMPSSLEQRTGRVDRVNSLAERRLSRGSALVGPDGRPPLEERIQVLYPYVSGTYEQLQVRRVLSRLDEHVRLLHESFGKKVAVSPRIDVDLELAAELPVSSPTTNLGEPYGIADTWLRTRRGRFPLVDASVAEAAHGQFQALVDRRRWGGCPVTWVSRGSSRHLLAELDLGARVQPLDLRLTSSHGHAAVRVTSPVGLCSADDVERLLDTGALPTDGARLGVVRLGPRDRRTFSVTVEDFVLLPRIGDVWRLLERRAFSVVRQADALERSLLSGDRPLETFAADLGEEVRDGRLA